MKLQTLLNIHAILFLVFGIAFGLYGPIMLAFFGVPELQQMDVPAYWNVAAFARMFGAALFGFGLLLWSLRPAISQLNPGTQRGIVFALLLGNIMCLIVSLTQQSSIWFTPAGWIASVIFALLVLGYGYLLAKHQS